MLEKMLIRIEIDLILDENRTWCLGKLEIDFALDFKIISWCLRESERRIGQRQSQGAPARKQITSGEKTAKYMKNIRKEKLHTFAYKLVTFDFCQSLFHLPFIQWHPKNVCLNLTTLNQASFKVSPPNRLCLD